MGILRGLHRVGDPRPVRVDAPLVVGFDPERRVFEAEPVEGRPPTGEEEEFVGGHGFLRPIVVNVEANPVVRGFYRLLLGIREDLDPKSSR